MTTAPTRLYVTDLTVEGEMEIVFVAAPEFGKFQTIGTRILTMSSQHQRLIDQCVAEIDRQQDRSF